MLALYVNAITLKSRLHAGLKRFVGSEAGVTAIEYGLIAGLISVLIIGAVTTIGTSLQTKFEALATALTPAAH